MSETPWYAPTDPFGVWFIGAVATYVFVAVGWAVWHLLTHANTAMAVGEWIVIAVGIYGVGLVVVHTVKRYP